MRVFKNKWFNHWARIEGVVDFALFQAAEEIAAGKVEANLGGCLFKKRMPRQVPESGVDTVFLWDIKDQMLIELFFSTLLPRAKRILFLTGRKWL